MMPSMGYFIPSVCRVDIVAALVGFSSSQLAGSISPEPTEFYPSLIQTLAPQKMYTKFVEGAFSSLIKSSHSAKSSVISEYFPYFLPNNTVYILFFPSEHAPSEP